MKKQTTLLLIAATAMASCSKLGNLSSDNFTVTPTPLEEVAGQVPATINGTFPEKYMKKKAVVTVTPVLKYENGEVAGTSATFQGEKVQDNNTTIQYKVGGTYTMKTTFDYVPAMMKSDLYARFNAKLGKKVVTIPEVKIGYGVIATADLLKRCTTTGSTAKDAFQRVIDENKEASIKYLINQAKVRTSETSSVSVQDLVKILKEINDSTETRALKGIEISAYASPDGKYSFNEQLAEKRQNTSSAYLKSQMKKINMNAAIDTKYTAEDWEGFQELVSQSNLQDKDVILRVLSMYNDPDEREQQIRNMSSVYTEIADGIMPQLRRARMIVNYSVIGRSDEQILAQFQADPSKLSVEEMLYGANNLVSDNATKKAWYNQTVSQYPNDVRAYNNLAAVAIAEGNTAEAQNWISRAKAVNANCPEANANTAILALKSGDTAAAQNALAKASGSDTFNEIMGNVNIAKGNYAQAAQNLAGTNTNSAALAQILNKDYASAKQTLSNIKNSDATTSYLKAIVAARTNDASSLESNLKAAISQDSTLATRAANDLEFANYSSIVSSLTK